MVIKIAQTPTPPSAVPDYPLPPLPTFDLEVGWREVYDLATGQFKQEPLTLLQILYPQDEDVGVVTMPQSALHDLWISWLKVMLWNFLGQSWLLTHDVIIHWARDRAPAKSPDLAAIPGGRLPAEDNPSYLVGRDGPLPAFVLEITSRDTRQVDLHEKPLLYAAVGVKEFLIIDLLTRRRQGWQLIGYRLEDGPYYEELSPDADGGLTFETIGLRFVAVGRERIEVYDAQTGTRLLTPPEAEAARAKAEARAETEKAARLQAEARAAELEARVRELEARYGKDEG
ncbi:MAG: hypothetical protein DPW09_34885 [Anaerolineae bacterium]|nr:Uma2 family endonuclease [Anaerolineales bacterium]MCQ3978637.1 hypothetical protein [Anaerolineae bacterium]